MIWRGWAWFAVGVLPFGLGMALNLEGFVLLAFIPLFICLRRALPYFDAADEASAAKAQK